jgi:hypothetical protein
MLTWRRIKDPDSVIAWQYNDAQTLAVVYEDRDWICSALIVGDPRGSAHLKPKAAPKTYAEAKRQCEAAAVRLLRARAILEGAE